jgi:hypothetical protein
MSRSEEEARAALDAEKRAIGLEVETEEDENPSTTGEEVTPKEKTEEDEGEKSKEDKPEIEDDEDEEDDDGDKPKRPKYIPIEVYNKRKGKLKDRIAELEEELEEARSSKDEGKEEEIESEVDDIKTAAEELGIDPEQLSKITSVIEKKLSKSVDERMSPLVKEQEAKKEEDGFNNEWRTTAEILKAKYPHASEKQLEIAKGKMKELAYSSTHLKHDLDYIVWKEDKAFEEILYVPKKKGIESAQRNPAPKGDEDAEEPGSKPLGDNPSPEEIKAREKYLDKVGSSGKTKTRMSSYNEATGELVDEEF